jgi:hypothetical protein
LACLTIVEVHLNLARYNNTDVLKWDVSSYYSYLPATFIDKDITLQCVNSENNVKEGGVKYWYVEDDKGHRVLKYSMGMSVLYAPFFFTAHVLASPFGFEADGFSPIYEFFIEFSGLFYLLFGLWYLRKLLLQFYNEKITAITLALVFFGTNLLYYSTVEAPMTHAYTFSLFAIFLYYVVDFYKKVRLNNVVALAVCFGLIVLVRPINILLILPFVFYNIGSLQVLKSRVTFLLQHYKYVVLFIGIVSLILLPQIIYYKYVTGNYFVFSYGKEGFFFNQCHVFDVLFSFRKGWFIYTPVMLFSIVGIWSIKTQESKRFITPILALVPIYLYMVSSWWCWWYGGSFSQRSLIDIYPLLALPLAAFVFKLDTKTNSFKKIGYTILSLLLLLSIFQTVQYKYNIIDFDGMTAQEYLHVFGTLDDEKIDSTLLEKPNYERAMLGLEK